MRVARKIMSNFTGRQKTVNFILTFIQYTTLIVFITLSPKVAVGWSYLSIEISGILLAIWAILVMSKSKLNIAPLPRSDTKMITSGPYKLIRHPMYLSLVLSLTPLLISYYSTVNALILLTLFTNLVFKILFEESVLNEYFDEYRDYTLNTKRIIPFIW